MTMCWGCQRKNRRNHKAPKEEYPPPGSIGREPGVSFMPMTCWVGVACANGVPGSRAPTRRTCPNNRLMLNTTNNISLVDFLFIVSPLTSLPVAFQMLILLNSRKDFLFPIHGRAQFCFSVHFPMPFQLSPIILLERYLNCIPLHRSMASGQ